MPRDKVSSSESNKSSTLPHWYWKSRSALLTSRSISHTSWDRV